MLSNFWWRSELDIVRKRLRFRRMEIGSDRVSDHFGVTDLLYHFEFFRELTVEHFFQVIHPATGDFIVIQLLKNRL